MKSDHLLVPLPLAEMLHVTLGPLTETLEKEDHPWVPLLRRVLAAYKMGRDDTMVAIYGNGIIGEIDVCTVQVAEEVCKVVDEIAAEETDFVQWSTEFHREEPENVSE